jgi:hypothetical protein
MPLVKVWTWLCNYSECEYVVTPLWGKCEDETHTPKNGNLESFGTPATSELDSRGQKSCPWGVLYTVGKVLKCKCRKWPRMGHLDICSTSFGQKKGRESNWQFDSWPPKVGNQPDPSLCRRSATHCWKALEENYKFASDLVPNRDSFGTPFWESRGKEPFGCRCGGVTQRILYGGTWWLPPSPGRGESSESKVTCGLSQHQKDAEWVLTNLWLVLDAGPSN